MGSSYLYLLPIAVFLWFNCTFLITFTIAVLLGHVHPVFPYISDTGTFSPESCIFGQLINIGTLLFGCVVYVRWRQGAELCTVYGLGSRTHCLNTCAAWTGFISSVGISFVANFQVTNVLAVHVGCATLGFGCGTAWLVMQTILSYRLYPLASAARWLLHLRTVISGFAIVAFFNCMLCGLLAYKNYKGVSVREMTQWTKEDGGWEFHLASTASEWCTAVLAMTFVLTLSGEFRRVWLSSPSVRVETASLLADTEAGDRAALPA